MNRQRVIKVNETQFKILQQENKLGRFWTAYLLSSLIVGIGSALVVWQRTTANFFIFLCCFGLFGFVLVKILLTSKEIKKLKNEYEQKLPESVKGI